MFPCVYFKLESFTMCTKKAISTQTQWNKNRVLGTCSRVFSFMLVKRSLSICMLSIQIDTKSLELVIQHQFNNIKLSFFSSHMNSSFPVCMFYRCCTVI